MPRFLPLALLALLLGAALPAAADPPPDGGESSKAESGTKSGAAKEANQRLVLPEIDVRGDVHEPQVTFITTRPRMNADGELQFEHQPVPALLAKSPLPRGDG